MYWGPGAGAGELQGRWGLGGAVFTGNWQRRYSWLSPQHGSSSGNLGGAGRPKCGQEPPPQHRPAPPPRPPPPTAPTFQLAQWGSKAQHVWAGGGCGQGGARWQWGGGWGGQGPHSPDAPAAAHREPPPAGAGAATPGSPRGPLARTLLGERAAGSAWREAGTPMPPAGSPCPLPPDFMSPPYLSTAPQTTAQEGPQQEVPEGAGSGGAEGVAAVGAASRPGGELHSALTGCVIWDSNLTSLSLPSYL